MNLPKSLAVVAGGGNLPRLVAQAASENDIKVFVVHLEGASSGFDDFSYITAKPERLGFVFKVLRERHISDLVLIGRLKRPKLWNLRPDWVTFKIMAGVAWALLTGGDDALLKAVRRMLEKQGFTLHAVQEFVSTLTAPAGPFSAIKPDIKALDDIRTGVEAARAHGQRDLGQAVAIYNGKVIAREGVKGTDAMIRSHPMPGAILVKTAKPGQDHALDLPSIGPETVDACIQAGYIGIAVETGFTLVADLPEVVTRANAGGIFLIGVT
jgi:DUF1009 family protein